MTPRIEALRTPEERFARLLALSSPGSHMSPLDVAVGMQDILLGPPAMEDVRATIRGCPASFEVADANHFVQEWGDQVARAALQAFGIA